MPPAQYSTHCDAVTPAGGTWLAVSTSAPSDAHTQAGGVWLASSTSAPSADLKPCVGGCSPRTIVSELARLIPIISALPNAIAIILRMWTSCGVVRSNDGRLTSSRYRLTRWEEH